MDRRRGERRVAPAWPVVLAFVLAIGASPAAPAAPGFESRGRVTGVDPGRKTVTLEHAGIPGLLPAALSEFPVAEVSLIRSVRTGDRVRFTLAAPDETHGLLTIASLAPEASASGGWLERLVPLVIAALALLALGAVIAVGVVLWRTTQSLHRRVIELNHEMGKLQGLVSDTQDGVRQMARALEDTAATLRVGYLRDVRRRMSGAPPASAIGAGGALPAGEPGNTLVVVQRGRGELYQAVESGTVGTGLLGDLGPPPDRASDGRAAAGQPRAAPDRAPGGAAGDLDAPRVPARPGRDDGGPRAACGRIAPQAASAARRADPRASRRSAAHPPDLAERGARPQPGDRSRDPPGRPVAEPGGGEAEQDRAPGDPELPGV